MGELLNRVNQDILGDYYQQNFTNNGERFVAWYLRNIHLRTAVQARDDITDGQHDKQIDAVIVDDERQRVLIIQGKFYSDTQVDNNSLHEVLAAWLHIRNLPKLQENANERLKKKLAAVEMALSDDYEVVFELITTGELTETAKKNWISFAETISEFEHPIASLALVDTPTLQARWDEAMARETPQLSHTFALESGRYLSLEVAHFKTVLAAIKLADCLKLPGIQEGTLFRKNVRQSLGLTNKVNKGLKQTINGETPQYFFLYHNGITALCENLQLDTITHQLQIDGLSIVNGCQSLNTILACGVKAKAAHDAYILFRFYEIPQRDIADKISINTNSQSAVKPRDLRSNDKRVLNLKRTYENTFNDGFFITKRGEERPADKNTNKTIDIATLAKCIMAWHCQRPNIAYNENKLFDKYFEQLFHPDYSPHDILALTQWEKQIERRWDENNLFLNEALAATPSYTKSHLLFAIQACFCVASGQIDKVPTPSATSIVLNDTSTVDAVITMAANCYNSALEAAIMEYQERNKVFSPQNWLKAIDSILKVQTAVKMYMGMIGGVPGGVALKKSLVLPANEFTLRWSAN